VVQGSSTSIAPASFVASRKAFLYCRRIAVKTNAEKRVARIEKLQAELKASAPARRVNDANRREQLTRELEMLQAAKSRIR
jgi:hypothetical protein